MEALNSVFSLILHEGPSRSLVGVFSSPIEARKEIERVERRDVSFYIQERLIDIIDEPSYEIEIKYCLNGQKSEMIVTRNTLRASS